MHGELPTASELSYLRIDSAIFRLNLGNSLYNVQCFHFWAWHFWAWHFKKKKNLTLFFRILRSVGRGQHKIIFFGLMHEICMASYPQLASLATYEFDSAIFRLNLGNSLYNVQCFHFWAWRIRIRIIIFIFFARVAEEFFEVARDTRILHWRDHCCRRRQRSSS